MPGHLVTMAVSIEAGDMGVGENITYEIEIRTADVLKAFRNKQGFQVSELGDTTLLQHYTVTLPDHYRDLFRRNTVIPMYVCITAKGQDIVLTALRPRHAGKIPDIEWLTLPEVLGTYGSDSVEMFKTAVQVTAASRQCTVPSFDISETTGDREHLMR
jgi:hypothetical protein